jgi:PmbA protein
MIDLNAYVKAFEALPAGTAEAEVNAEAHRVSLVRLIDGEVASSDQAESAARFLRVTGERTGYLYTQDPAEDPVRALREALENGACSESPRPDAMRRGGAAFRKDFGSTAADGDLRRLADFGRDFSAAVTAALPAPMSLSLSVRAETIGLRTVNTHGLDAGFERPLYIVDAAGVSIASGRRCSASFNRTAASPEAFSAREFADELAELAASQGNQAPFKSGAYPAVLRRNVVYNILSTAWQLFSAKRCLEGSSLFEGRPGAEAAAPCVSFTDYPAIAGSGFDYPCDCEGSPGETVPIVRRGILTGLMHNLSTAEAMGAVPTGNAGRRPLLSGSIPTEIQATPRNFCLEPGTATLDELVDAMGDGVLVTGSFDVFHSINIASGSFSIPCRGVAVRGGKRISATGPIVFSGNLGSLLKSIAGVGNDLYWGTMLALDNYGIGACSVLVDALSFSGASGG